MGVRAVARSRKQETRQSVTGDLSKSEISVLGVGKVFVSNIIKSH